MTPTRRTPDEETTQISLPELLREHERRPYLVALAGSEIGTCWRIGARMVIGRGDGVDVSLSGGSVSRRHAEISAGTDGAAIVDLGSTNGTFVNGSRVARSPLHDGDRVQLGSSSILRFTYQDTLETNYHARLAESAYRDALTGLHNRRFLDDRFPGEIAYAVRHGAPLSIVMFDVDYFKEVNDLYGHLAGDAALVSLAALARRAVRAEDILVRHGGEEFVVLCRATAQPGALRLAERLRAGVEALAIDYDDRVLRVTISLGVAVFDVHGPGDATALLGAADRAMYGAKRAGRNRVQVA